MLQPETKDQTLYEHLLRESFGLFVFEEGGAIAEMLKREKQQQKVRSATVDVRRYPKATPICTRNIHH